MNRLLGHLGYVADRDFNAINGRTRMLFRDEANGRDLDVLIGEFSMCHVLPILEEIIPGEPTVPLADLLLTKLQIIELRRRTRSIFTICCTRTPWSPILHRETRSTLGGSRDYAPKTGACGARSLATSD